ncbi:MAG: hypothetical protein FWC47_01545 [Oscillospiraceae bacterium]|nr:hypothetical protein [Oscillospiraceae bacterium]
MKVACTVWDKGKDRGVNPESYLLSLDPVAVLLRGDESMVEHKVRDCIDSGDNYSLIAAGCEVPAETPEKNLLAMDKQLYVH